MTSRQPSDYDLDAPIVTSMQNAKYDQSSDPPISLSQVIAELDELTQSYESDYTELTDVMAEVSDTNQELNRERKQLLCDTRNQYISTEQERIQIDKEFANNTVADKLNTKLQQLQAEGKELINDQDDLLTLNENRKFQRQRNSEHLAELKSKMEELKRKESDLLPFLSFVRRLLVGVSSATLHKKNSSTVIEGFVGKTPQINHDADVIPFKCDLDQPPSTYVNKIWDLIEK